MLLGFDLAVVALAVSLTILVVAVLTDEGIRRWYGEARATEKVKFDGGNPEVSPPRRPDRDEQKK